MSALEFHGAVSFVTISRVCCCVYMSVIFLACLPFSFLFTPKFVLTLKLLLLSFVFFITLSSIFRFYLFPWHFFVMSRSANGVRENPAMLSSGVRKNAQVADANATSNTRATDIEIDRGVPTWSVAEHKARYADILDTRWFSVIFWTVLICLFLIVRTFTVIRMLVLVIESGRICGDGAAGLWKTWTSLTFLSFAMRMKLISSVVYFAACGFLMLRSNIGVLRSNVSRICSIGSTLCMTQTLSGVSWSSKVGNGIMRMVCRSLGGIVWRCLYYSLVRELNSALRYHTFGSGNRIFVMEFQRRWCFRTWLIISACQV